MKRISLQLTFVIFFCSFLGTTFAQKVDSIRLLQHLAELSSDKYEGRGTGEKGNALARAYLVKQFEKMNLLPFGKNYVQPIVFLNWLNRKRVDGNNVVAYVKGTSFPDQYIVISGHYDHLGIKRKKIYNGADDNASGTGALLELAAYFAQHPPKHSIIFAAFDAEELGLQGAKCFVDEPPVAREKIILNINMDMISRNTKQEIYICGTYHYPFLKEALEEQVKASALTALFGHDNPTSGSENWTSSSDHGAFHAEKIPFLYFGEEDHVDYHKASDDFENIDPSFYYHATQLVLECTQQLDAVWEQMKK